MAQTNKFSAYPILLALLMALSTLSLSATPDGSRKSALLSKLGMDTMHLGIKALEADKLELAEEALKGALEVDPTNDRARLELARTYFAMGKPELSRKLFQEVLEHEPPTEVKENINRFLARITEMEPTKSRFNVRVTAGTFYDDNVNYGPTDSTIKIRSLNLGGASPISRLTVNPDTAPKDDYGAYVLAAASGSYDLGEPNAWGLMGGLNYYQSFLQEHSDFELVYGTAYAGLRHTSDERVAKIPLSVDHVRLDGDALVNIYGTRPSLLTVAKVNRHYITSGILEYRDYEDTSARDSVFGEYRETMRQFFGKPRHNASLSLAVSTEDADNGVYDNIAVGAGASGEYKLPHDFSVYAGIKFRREWYDEREALAPESRRDNDWEFNTGINKQVADDVGVDLNYQFIMNDSTFDIYSFERNKITLNISTEL